MGCDVGRVRMDILPSSFQSTHPVWDATDVPAFDERFAVISIHASRMGCDDMETSIGLSVVDFNPRIPYGMRLERRVLPARLA